MFAYEDLIIFSLFLLHKHIVCPSKSIKHGFLNLGFHTTKQARGRSMRYAVQQATLVFKNPSITIS